MTVSIAPSRFAPARVRLPKVSLRRVHQGAHRLLGQIVRGRDVRMIEERKPHAPAFDPPTTAAKKDRERPASFGNRLHQSSADRFECTRHFCFKRGLWRS
jgi:hypothetical protein